MKVRLARGLAAPVERMVARVLGELGPVEALPGTLVVGADDPMLPGADARRPLAVMPARGPARPTPWGAALVAAADAVILLDAAETHPFTGLVSDLPILVAGLAAPVQVATESGVDFGDAPAEVLRAWGRLGSTPDSPAGVAWVWGHGVAPLAAAVEAWGAGRAVVVLPQTDDHDLLRRGRALRAHSVAEAIEATRFLLENAALAQALGARGREVASRLPSPRQVALRLLEGVELARQSASAAG